MLVIRYRNRQTVFQYSIPKRDAAEMLVKHMMNWRYETVDDVQREIPTTDIIAEWVDGERVESIAVPNYAPPPKR